MSKSKKGIGTVRIAYQKGIDYGLKRGRELGYAVGFQDGLKRYRTLFFAGVVSGCIITAVIFKIFL